MTAHIFGAVLLPLRDLRLGPVRLSPYGLCASVGVVLSMVFAGRLARRTGTAPDAVWDTGFFAILCCFLASRALLIVADPRAFLAYPVLVLSLPSLTIAGIALAGVATWIYALRKRLLVLALLDTFAAPGALLAMWLELGHVLDESEVGMPVLRGDKVAGFQPVSVYGVILSAGLMTLLWFVLGRTPRPGRVAALGLVIGGAIAFGLDMVTLPSELFGTLPLEPGQIVALGAMLAGALLWVRGGSRSAAQRSTPATTSEVVNRPTNGIAAAVEQTH